MVLVVPKLLRRIFPLSIQLAGVAVLAYLFALIAVGHWVTRAAFALGWGAVPIFAGIGLFFLYLSLRVSRVVLSIIYAVTAAVSFWAIVEVIQHVLDLHIF